MRGRIQTAHLGPVLDDAGVLPDDCSAREAIAVADVINSEVDLIAALSLLSIAKLKSARSRVRPSISSRVRMTQISFGLKGAFWPTVLPLFPRLLYACRLVQVHRYLLYPKWGAHVAPLPFG